MALSPGGYRSRDSTVAENDGVHGRDVEAQEDDRVTRRNYGFDEDQGAVVSLFEGPGRDARARVHLKAHG